MEITRTTMKAFRKDFAETVKALEEKYGVVLSLGDISFSKTQFHVRLTGVSGESPADAEKTAFETMVGRYSMYGLTKNDYRKKFVVDGKTYYLVGFNPKAKKNCFKIKNEAGKQYVCRADFLGLLTGEEHYEMTAAFGKGAKVVNVITGAEYQL